MSALVNSLMFAFQELERGEDDSSPLLYKMGRLCSQLETL